MSPSSRDGHRQATRPWFRKKSVILVPVLIVMLVGIWGASRGDLGTFITAATGGSQTKASSAPGVSPAAPIIGTKVRDGGFEFLVTGVERPGKTLPGKVGEMLTAQGEFVSVLVNVTNIGDKEQIPTCTCQILINSQGQTFKPSGSILRTKQALKFVQRIRPGETVNGFVLLFDVPPETQVSNIELHDSPDTPGVTVKLS